MDDARINHELLDLVDKIKERLRDAERLRNHEEERRRQTAFWPDRRRASRVPELEDSHSSHDRRSRGE
jgi:hypothetical protein